MGDRQRPVLTGTAAQDPKAEAGKATTGKTGLTAEAEKTTAKETEIIASPEARKAHIGQQATSEKEAPPLLQQTLWSKQHHVQHKSPYRL